MRVTEGEAIVMDNAGKRFRLFGIEMDAIDEDQVILAVDSAVGSRKHLSLGMVNAAKIVNMQSDSELFEDVMSSDIVVADGMSIVMASRILRRPLPSRVAGIDLMHRMLGLGSEKGFRFYLFGATQEVLERVHQAFRNDYPGAVIAGTRNGYYTAADEQDIADSIRDANADVLFVAMPSPRKERFMAKWRDYIDVPVVHGVGGSFDVVSGKVRRAPMFMQRAGLEWLYRLGQEPLRLGWRYIRTNTIFLWLLFLELFRRNRQVIR
jgi:N-acetylglucosaminyldiphosphoundecaprenol N-acetyl-beta-D-mannosaminyltransferase